MRRRGHAPARPCGRVLRQHGTRPCLSPTTPRATWWAVCGYASPREGSEVAGLDIEAVRSFNYRPALRYALTGYVRRVAETGEGRAVDEPNDPLWSVALTYVEAGRSARTRPPPSAPKWRSLPAPPPNGSAVPGAKGVYSFNQTRKEKSANATTADTGATTPLGAVGYPLPRPLGAPNWKETHRTAREANRRLDEVRGRCSPWPVHRPRRRTGGVPYVRPPVGGVEGSGGYHPCWLAHHPPTASTRTSGRSHSSLSTASYYRQHRRRYRSGTPGARWLPPCRPPAP